MNLLHDALIALLSGVTSYYPDHPKEIVWEDKYGDPITIELVDAEQEKCIVRRYHENGQLHREYEYQNGQHHGKGKSYHKNGQLHWECDYQNGVQVK